MLYSADTELAPIGLQTPSLTGAPAMSADSARACTDSHENCVRIDLRSDAERSTLPNELQCIMYVCMYVCTCMYQVVWLYLYKEPALFLALYYHVLCRFALLFV